MVPLHHLGPEVLDVLAVSGGDRGHGGPGDADDELGEVGGVEGHAEGAELEEDDAQGPDVRGPGVGSLLAHLRRQVVRRTDRRLRHPLSALQHLGDAEISDFQGLVPGEEHVLGLQVPVEDALVVDVLEGDQGLGRPLQDLGFTQPLPRPARALHDPEQIPPLRILHHDVQHVLLREALTEPDDVRVLQGGKHVGLVTRVFLLLRAQAGEVHLLNHQQLIVLGLHQHAGAEAP
mmetsp:Transcript_19835/g.50420  ORF Transcript_19835/g.50420 Transcript_19835/m.50420 type:complete len:233 (-) Transcript_19835:56-754(-)